MAKCITFDATQRKELVNLIGYDKAEELINKYKSKIPEAEVIKGIRIWDELSNNPTYAESNADLLEKSTIEFTASASSAIGKTLFKLNNELKKQRLNLRNDVDAEKSNAKIVELEDNIRQLKNNKSLMSIVDITKTSLDSWIKKDVFESKDYSISTVKKAYDELEVLDGIIKELLVREVDLKTGKNKYKFTNKKVFDEAEKVVGEIAITKNKLNGILDKVVLTEHNKVMNRNATIDDLTNYIDTDMGTAVFLDPSRTKNPIAKFVHKIMAFRSKNAKVELNETLVKTIDKLAKDSGLDMTKQANNDIFLQKDKNGKTLPNILSEYSYEYSEFYTDLRDSLASYSRVAEHVSRKNSKLAKRGNELVDKINKNYIVADTRKLLSSDEKVVEEEKSRMISEVGEEKATELIEQAIDRYDKYQNQYEAYKERLDMSKDNDSDSIESASKLAAKLKSFENRYSPLKVLEALSGEGGDILLNGFYKLAIAPKRMIDNKDTGFYDKRYNALKNNKENSKKYELLSFIKNKLKEYYSYFPPEVTDKLQDNYLAEVFGDNLFDVFKKGNVNILKDKIYESVATKEVNNIQRGIVNAKNQQIKKVPIEYMSDKIGNLNYRIKRINSKIEENNDIIESYLQDIEKYQTSQLKFTNVKSIFDSYNERIKSKYDKIAELEQQNSELSSKPKELEDAKNLMLEKKSTNIVEVMKNLGLMSLNYKNKIQIQDIVELARRKLVDGANQLVETKKGRPLRAAVTEYVNKNGQSAVEKMVNDSMDAMLYGEFKNNKGFTDKYIGIDAKSREKVSDYKKEKTKLKDKLFKGEIKDDEFIESLDTMKEMLNKEAGVRTMTLSDVADTFNAYVYRLNMGWNPLSAASNVVYGKMANQIEAGANVFYNSKDLKKAYRLLGASAMKSLTGSANTTATKIYNLILNYGTMFDLLEDSFGATKGLSDKQKKLGFLNMMEGQRRGEYRNQGAVLLAMMEHVKVKLKDGTEMSLLDAHDNSGKIRDDVENVSEWKAFTEDGTINKAAKFRASVQQLVKRLHGNYDPDSMMAIKKSVLGRFLMTFHTYLPEAIATRFETEKFDEELNYIVKGRYRTYGTLGFKRSLTALSDIIMNKYFNKDISKYESIPKIDLENMKRNAVEVQWGLSMMALTLLSTMFFDDDDRKTFAMRHTLDLLGRAQNDISQFVSPPAILNMVKNPFPQYRVLQSMFKYPEVIYKYSTMDDIHHDNEYLFRNTAKQFPGAKQFHKMFLAEPYKGNQ